MTKLTKDLDNLLRQSVIVSNLMLKLIRGFHGDYRRKHIGSVWEELLVAFVLWRRDTVRNPETILGIAKFLGIPRSNVGRAIIVLEKQGLVCKVGRRWGRNTDFISARPNSRFFRQIRDAVMEAGDGLQKIYKTVR